MSDAESTQGAVLVVDDEAPIVAALVRALERRHYRVIGTTEPTEAVGIIGREKVEVLIADLDMPRMHGLELVSAVRAAHPGVVRMILTGRGSFDSAMKAINQGEVFRYLTKPWNNEELYATVDLAFTRAAELRKADETARAAARRGDLLAALERDFPGLTGVPALEDAYAIEEVTAMATLERLGLV